ncbi:MAG: helicase-exonuclease AddAB subunit AddA [Lachnospiraceae bacterium]|nr:helicase-exonuclease AddAB subunit AddA [Lachnospiraceae bacterium]
MSEMKFTEDQQKVIDLHQRNILVSAAAGSGKTAVLVERIIQMVSDGEHPVDIDRLLVVTFTKAAAAEMRERISAAISARLQEEADNDHLQRQATLIHNAQITTIDSFCMYVVRNHFEAIGLDPDFRTCAEGEKQLLMENAMEELLERKYEEKDPVFLKLVDCYGSDSQRGLSALIRQVAEYALSYPWPEQWLEEHRQDYHLESVEALKKSDWYLLFGSYVRSILGDIRDEYKELLALTQEPDGPYMYGPMVESELEQLEKILEAEDMDQLGQRFMALNFERLSTKKDDTVDEAKKQRIKNYRSDLKEKVIKPFTKKYFTHSAEEQLKRMKELAPLADAFLGVCKEYLRTFSALKRDKNIIDFTDMEHLALEILTTQDSTGKIVPSDVALELRDYYEEILIDEYQDSNLVQEVLLSSISREGIGAPNRFMVGDVKQSIYRFRMARPELFMEKYEAYPVTDGLYQRINLAKNFRSRSEVLDVVNALFYQLMGKDLGGVEYSEEVALHPGAAFKMPKDHAVEALVVDLKDIREAIPDRKTGSNDYARLEARAIALRIQRLLKEETVQDKNGEIRPVAFRDIVILMRSPSGLDSIYQQELAQYGIPVYISSSKGYFGTTEVQSVLQLLKCVDNPRNDIPLFGTLHSFFGGFTDGELATLQAELRRKGDTLYDALLRSRDPHVLEFMAMLRDLQHKETYLSIEELLQDILNETGFLPYVTAMPEGEKRSANVRMLLEKAAEFEETSFHGLNQFVRYMDQLEKYNVDYGEAETLDETANVVRIMSIHKSKGLEFPVCFVSALGKKFNRKDSTGALLTDMDLGIGMDLLQPDRHIKRSTLRKEMLAQKLNMDFMGEEIRVLYVALTRAKEKLILTGFVKDGEKEIPAVMPMDPRSGEAGKRLSFSKRLNADSYLALLLSGSMPGIVDFQVITSKELEEAKVGQVIMGTESLLQLQDHLKKVRAGEVPLAVLLPKADSVQLEELKQRFAFTYPHQELEHLFIKTSVSELKLAAMPVALEDEGEDKAHAMYEEKLPAPYIPHFMQKEETLGGAGAGTAVHRFMELLHFDQPMEGQLEHFVEEGRMNRQQADAVNPGKIQAFLASELGKRMAQAEKEGRLRKEQPFVISLDSSVINASPGFVKDHGLLPEGERILVQGVIDACFKEGDDWILMDYKTDRVESAEELSAKYRVQLEFYKKALEQLTGSKVKEMWLYSFRLDKEILL